MSRMTKKLALLFCALLLLSLPCVLLADELNLSELPEAGESLELDLLQPDPEESFLPPALSEAAARVRLYGQFPHLKNYPSPQMELTQYTIPAGQLSVYSYYWEAYPSLAVDQNADSGDVLQYFDLDSLYNLEEADDRSPISAGAAKMLATSRMKRLMSEEELAFYPGEPELEYDEGGPYLFFWTRTYHGYPYEYEQLAIAIHPYTGMPVAVINQRDYYSANGNMAEPGQVLSPEAALQLVQDAIDPVLINLHFDEETSVLVWYNNLSIDYMDASGASLASMYKEAGEAIPEDAVLLVSKEAAAQRLRDMVSVELVWVTQDYIDDESYPSDELVLAYAIHLVPPEGSPLTVIPALISDAEFNALVETYLGMVPLSEATVEGE